MSAWCIYNNQFVFECVKMYYNNKISIIFYKLFFKSLNTFIVSIGSPIVWVTFWTDSFSTLMNGLMSFSIPKYKKKTL